MNCRNIFMKKVSVVLVHDMKNIPSLICLGLTVQYKENVKLHVTLINTKYRNETNENLRKKRWVKRQPFDASNIMAKYKDYHFGECNFDSVHLSLISSIGEDGFYVPLHVVKLT